MALFSRRHYAWLASVCRDADAAFDSATDREVVRSVVETLANALLQENPDGFDREKFLWNVYIGNPPSPSTNELTNPNSH